LPHRLDVSLEGVEVAQGRWLQDRRPEVEVRGVHHNVGSGRLHEVAQRIHAEAMPQQGVQRGQRLSVEDRVVRQARIGLDLRPSDRLEVQPSLGGVASVESRGEPPGRPNWRARLADVGDLHRAESSVRRSPDRSVESVAVKRIGFLSFGHWTNAPSSSTRSASDALLQSIELAVAAEELGADGAYFRVHHFARQLASPFPLLAAIGARTSRIEIGTAVIDMRYENPYYMVEDAGAADLIAGGRVQLGISRGSPEQVIDGFRYFVYEPPDGETAAEMARR